MTRLHWSDAYYGDLYFDSAADLLTPALSAFEADVIARLLELRPGQRVLDLACGHGRHAWPLLRTGATVVGLERSERYLRRAIVKSDGSRAATPLWLRGDVRTLPLRDGSFDAAFSWYSSLFMYDDVTNAGCLASLGRVVRPGGRILVHHANPAALARTPNDSSRRVLSDGSVVEEESLWDAAAGVDRCSRRLRRPDGTLLTGTAELRYYAPREWGALAEGAGLRLLGLTHTGAAGAGMALGDAGEAADLIAVLERKPPERARRGADSR